MSVKLLATSDGRRERKKKVTVDHQNHQKKKSGESFVVCLQLSIPVTGHPTSHNNTTAVGAGTLLTLDLPNYREVKLLTGLVDFVIRSDHIHTHTHTQTHTI